ncbi:MULTISPECIES: hypothetical protein [unclassified Burkholderia]|uniref:hypothetical protein n=1 Tax=unclassified Burkholderia TaxID=2613784 RepID=UPI0019808081|nr:MULTISPECIES: hypothetical protein [unclassified Burkholderia]MBN3744394.1 hypothetical protein [Burkholderia sp. Se-20373]MBN3796587.1 hypothetical protein [Burkholderia sp. Ac-20392]
MIDALEFSVMLFVHIDRHRLPTDESRRADIHLEVGPGIEPQYQRHRADNRDTLLCRLVHALCNLATYTLHSRPP